MLLLIFNKIFLGFCVKRIPNGVLTVFHPSPQFQEKIASFAQYYTTYYLLLLGLYLIVSLFSVSSHTYQVIRTTYTPLVKDITLIVHFI